MPAELKKLSELWKLNVLQILKMILLIMEYLALYRLLKVPQYLETYGVFFMVFQGFLSFRCILDFWGFHRHMDCLKHYWTASFLVFTLASRISTQVLLLSVTWTWSRTKLTLLSNQTQSNFVAFNRKERRGFKLCSKGRLLCLTNSLSSVLIHIEDLGIISPKWFYTFWTKSFITKQKWYQQTNNIYLHTNRKGNSFIYQK